MPRKIKDLTGQTFGSLLVLQLDTQKQSSSTNKYWKCKCLNCGKIISKRQDNLQKAKSCGCLSERHKFEKGNTYSKLGIHYKDYSGQRFGKLIALYPTQKRSTQNRVYWHCKCDCGSELDVLITNLLSGNTSSCGCMISKGEEKISQILSDNNILFEKQKTFNTCRFPDTNALGKFDFYVNNNYLIEYDGQQHFIENSWRTLEYTQSRDNFKNKWCYENNIPLIRIPYTRLEYLQLNDLLLETSQFKVLYRPFTT